MYDLDEWLKRDPQTWQMSGGRPQPEGMGLTALCNACNVDLLGREYVPAFVQFVDAGKQMLRALVDRLEFFDTREEETTISARFLAIERARVAKQIVSMLLVTCGRDTVVDHPALAEFVLRPDARGLPPQYRLFLALTPGPAAKTTGVSTRLKSNGEQAVFAEVVYPPFAYALSLNGTAIHPSGEITSWADASTNEGEIEVEIDLLLGFVYTVFPGDLRNSTQIRMQQRKA